MDTTQDFKARGSSLGVERVPRRPESSHSSQAAKGMVEEASMKKTMSKNCKDILNLSLLDLKTTSPRSNLISSYLPHLRQTILSITKDLLQVSLLWASKVSGLDTRQLFPSVHLNNMYWSLRLQAWCRPLKSKEAAHSLYLIPSTFTIIILLNTSLTMRPVSTSKIEEWCCQGRIRASIFMLLSSISNSCSWIRQGI